MRKSILVFLSLIGLQACTPVQDYMLGKDNTPQPSPLKEIKPKVKVATNWTVPVGKKNSDTSYHKMKPVVRGEVIYSASPDGQVQAMNLKDSKVLWSKDIGAGIVSGPTVAEGIIALGTDNSTLLILNQANGKEIWHQKLSNEILAKPIISHQKVIAKAIDGNLYAFDLVNGEKLWVADHGAPSLILKASSSPVVLGDLVLVGYSDGKLDAVNIESGQVMWQRSIAYPSGASDVERLVDIDADPIVKDDVAYLATYQGYIGALSLKDGQFLWRKPASTYKNLVLFGHTLYMTDADDVLWSIDSKSGRVNWQQRKLKARGLTEPVLVDNHLAVADKTGLVHILSPKTGEIIGRSQLSGAVISSPMVASNKLYIQTANGMLNQLSVS